ncbi:hypothetical protein BDZ97DRAFT_1756424 [Flammula alnicola]|nr:hypothetical protein BDZ97DRAFT_1756424 [Flammula alnicola]
MSTSFSIPCLVLELRLLLLFAFLSTVTTPIAWKPLEPACKHPIENIWEEKNRRSPVAPGLVARYDDFITTHILQTFSIHYVGNFLPWHRYFTAVYEKALREECGYSGAHPLQCGMLHMGFMGLAIIEVPADDPLAVPGRTRGSCVVDGPFKNKIVNMGPGPASNVAGNPRCLSRDFSPYFAGRYLGVNVTKVTLTQPDFGWFDRVVEGGPSFDLSGLHGGGHSSVGGTLGEMGDLYNSPADPVFFLHHANLDRVRWSWQKKDLSTRLKDISGSIILMDHPNLKGGNVTLAFPLSLGVNAPNVTIADVMDIQGGTLCCDYDHLYNL